MFIGNVPPTSRRSGNCGLRESFGDVMEASHFRPRVLANISYIFPAQSGGLKHRVGQVKVSLALEVM